MTAANTERQWQGLCAALGKEALVEDPRFRTNEDRRVHRDELNGLLEPAFARLDVEHATRVLQEAGVPSAPIHQIDEALSDAQARHRQMVVSLGPGGPKVVGGVIRAGEPLAPARPAPRLGEHTAAVLEEWLGEGEPSCSSLFETGVARGDGGAATAQGAPR